MRPPRVEFLWWQGCPSWSKALSDLREAMTALGLDSRAILLREMETDADAAAAGFIGSPTIRVDGTDVAPTGDEPTGLTCRVYHLRDGRVSALPDPDDVRDALQRRSEVAGG